MNQRELAAQISSGPVLSTRAITELSIIIPTFNERPNLAELVQRLDHSLMGIEWEAIFVDDDSPDGTAEEVRKISRRNPRVRCLQRINRRGLSAACIEGFLSSSSPIVAVMDADLQHDEALLADMLDILRRESVDIVIASRYVSGGGTGGRGSQREWMSRFATKISRLVLPADLTDPLSGFFMVRREVFEGAVRSLSGIGFKILLDLFASSPGRLRYVELPFTLRDRHAGESKLDIRVMWEYLMMLADRIFGHIVPVRFVAFVLVGGIGVAVHFLLLGLSYKLAGAPFIAAQSFATFGAITSNFFLNNSITYYDQRLKGWQLLRGWISFSLACSIGAMANVGIAGVLFTHHVQWLLSAICGVLISAVWNYSVTAEYTWSVKRIRRPSHAQQWEGRE